MAPVLMASLFELPGRVWQRLTALPALWIGVIVVVATGVVVGAGVSLYRTYDYVQHDNDFCMSCHLMAEPFERFAQSAHRGLGCKACHQPTFAARSQMALTQILEQPEELGVHAEVPNERCTECHVEGDPEEWTLIANAVGHRVHLESEDPSLQGVQCVKCHSSSVHEFAATDKTCGQAGCHESTGIRLGEMANLTIHCATCHDFAKPVAQDAPAETLAVALRPQREECLSCHAMRSMLRDFPADDPHDAVCSACHNPHEQETPQDAVTQCLDCHARPDTITPLHRGLDPGVLDNCTMCHQAHEFGAGRQCIDCHEDIFEGPEATVTASRARPPQPGEPAGMLPALWQQAPRDTVRFRHARHRDVECVACHSSERSHGSLRITGLRDCRSCHHTDPVAEPCAACHSESAYRARPYTVRQVFRFSVAAGPVRRAVPFDHGPHDGISCRECHTGNLDLSAASVRCASCHEEHHDAGTTCMTCHETAREGAHDLRVHASCTTAGCHDADAVPFEQVPRTRNVCLVCHQDLTDHRPGRSCAGCHGLPTTPTGARGGAGSEALSVYGLSRHPSPRVREERR